MFRLGIGRGGRGACYWQEGGGGPDSKAIYRGNMKNKQMSLRSLYKGPGLTLTVGDLAGRACQLLAGV